MRKERLFLRLKAALAKLDAKGCWTKWIEVHANWVFWAERQGA